MSYGSLLKEIHEQLLLSTGLRKDDFSAYKQRLESRPTFEDYVFPHKLTAAEAKVKTDFAKFVSADTPIESSSEITLIEFGIFLLIYSVRFTDLFCSYSENVRHILHLAVPKKVIEYAGPDTYDASDPTKGKLTKGKRIPKQRKSTQDAASIYDDEPASKKQKSSSTSIDTIVLKKPPKVEPKQIVGLPSNFSILVKPFFEDFWKLEFDDTEVTWAFFAKINSSNCAEYKLSAFAEQSTSLAVIKVPFRLLQRVMPYNLEVGEA